jgi:hypothetical protein
VRSEFTFSLWSALHMVAYTRSIVTLSQQRDARFNERVPKHISQAISEPFPLEEGAAFLAFHIWSRPLVSSRNRIPFESSHCGIRRSNNRVSGPTLAAGDACVTENVAQCWVRWNAFLYHSYNFSKTAPSTAPLSLTSPASSVAA